MNYYAVERSSDVLMHYGIPGMRWGVRKNPQKAFYRSMKREMKIALKANKAAHGTEVSGAKNIGKTLPKKMIRDYVKSRDRIERAVSSRENYEDRVRENYAKIHKPMTKQQQQRFLEVSEKLLNNESAAFDAHRNLMNNARSELLGKYGKKKIRMDSHNTRMKRDADYILDAAFASQMPKRNPARLNAKQKALESKWKKAYKNYQDAPNGKVKRQLSEANMKAADNFFKSMSEKQREKYHNRYLL